FEEEIGLLDHARHPRRIEPLEAAFQVYSFAVGGFLSLSTGVGAGVSTLLRQATKRFRAPAGARASFSLRAQRESSQRETAPRGGAFRPSMDGKSASRGRAFRPDSCPVEKASPSMAMPAARPDRPRLTAAEGPRRAGAHRARQKQQRERKQKLSDAIVLSPSPAYRGGLGWGALASARRERAALPGAPMTRRAGGGKSAGWLAGMRASFSPVHGRAVEKPRNPPAHPEGRMPGGRAIGVSFPLGYFSLTPGILPSALRASFAVRRRSCGGVDKQRRSNSGAAGARNALFLTITRRAKAPLPYPSSSLLHAERAQGCARLW